MLSLYWKKRVLRYRLLPLSERGDFFTDKCISAAKRVRAALVRTPDLFIPAKYIKETPADAEYVKQCREAIFLAAGQIVTFPAPPVGDATVIAETPKATDTTKPNLQVDTDAPPASSALVT